MINQKIKIALAGVGKPKYFSEFLISLKALYFASLIAPNTTGQELSNIKRTRGSDSISSVLYQGINLKSI